jgi:hypothetical protein
MSGEDEAQARYWRNIDQAARVDFDIKAEILMQIANSDDRDAEIKIKIAKYLKDMCMNF